MKRVLIILAAALLLLAFCPGFTALAAEEEETELLNVTDVGEVLTNAEWNALMDRTQEMTEQYGCRILIVTWDDLEGDYDNAWDFASDLFDWYDPGYGPDKSCIMLALSLEDGFCDVFTHGLGSKALNEEACTDLVGAFMDTEGTWIDAFNTYLDLCEDYLEAAAAGTLTRDAGSAGETAETLDYVTDAAELLTESDRETLNRKAAALTEKYDIAVRILTVPSIGSYNVEDFSEAAFDQYHLGYGPQESCIMLLLSMEYRDYDIFAHGYGNYAFTDYGKEKIANHIVPKLGQNDWYGAFLAFLEDCDDYLDAAGKGEPIDVKRGGGGGDEMPSGTRTLLHVVIGLIPALIVTLSMKGKMKTVRKQRAAGNYTGMDQLALSRRDDRFLRRSVSRTKIETNSGSRSGGGTSVNSHGSSHHSGKF